MAASIEGCRAKLGWGIRHLKELEQDIQAFTATESCEFGVERDYRQRVDRIRVTKIPPLPQHWGLLIGDCLHNLRSTLDHLVFQLAIAGRGGQLTPDEERRCMFPITTDAESWNRLSARWLCSVGDRVKERVEQLQPFNWRSAFWGPLPGVAPLPTALRHLDELDIVDKHRTIHPVLFGPVSYGRFPAGLGEPAELRQLGSILEAGEEPRHRPTLPPKRR